MKKIGLIILGVGILITLVTGFSFMTREKVMDIGDLEITRNKKHSYAWTPVAGIVVMAIGGGLMIWGAKKQ